MLKPDGLLVFTFHHAKPWAWELLAQVLLEAGFYVSATPVVRSEGKSGFHSSAGNIRYDAVLVCRKRPNSWHERCWAIIKKHIYEGSVEWVRRTLESGMPINQVDVVAIVMAKIVEYWTKCEGQAELQGAPISLAKALADTQSLVAVVLEQACTGRKHRKEMNIGQQGTLFTDLDARTQKLRY
ncbi:MAG: hypothetical protein RMJ82_08350 [Gemmatales bacterium]|nr:hypothetical protein [Gemmatales bacterium]